MSEFGEGPPEELPVAYEEMLDLVDPPLRPSARRLLPLMVAVSNETATAQAEAFGAELVDRVIERLLTRPMKIKRGSTTLEDTLPNFLAAADPSALAIASVNSRAGGDAQEKQATFDRFAKATLALLTTGIVLPDCLSSDPTRHKLRVQLLFETLLQCKDGTPAASLRPGEKAQFGRAAERFASIFSTLLIDPHKKTPNEKLIAQVARMCNTLSTALQAAGNLASIPLFDPAMTDSNTKKVMQEALAIVLWKNEPYTLRLYLCAVFNSELTGNTESGANTRLATLMKERCPASTLCLLLDAS